MPNTAIKFTKMQGLGNDFVVIDATGNIFDLKQPQIEKLADRRFGIGFDQLLVIEPAHDETSDFTLRIFNADGLEVGQCGNGARCIGRYIAERGLSKKKSLILKTFTSRIELFPLENHQVKVNMGIPEFNPQKIPMIAQRESPTYTLEIDGTPLSFSALALGNPHAVIVVKDIQKVDVSRLGALLEQHSRFPERVNVGFMQVRNRDHIILRVYERGSGETLACGSGACAAMVAGRKAGLLNERVQVDQEGGALIIEWAGNKNPIMMSGPAEFVFDGEIHI